MENKVSKTTIFYHKFLVYLPPLLVIFLITMIYVSYCANYLTPLLLNYNTQEEIIKNFSKYPFALTSSPQKSYVKGVVLTLFTTSFLLILMVCLLRTIFSDPGLFPSPLDLEFNIVLKNLLHEKNKPEINCKDKKEGTKTWNNQLNLENALENEIVAVNKNHYFYLNEKTDAEKVELKDCQKNKNIVDKYNNNIDFYDESKDENLEDNAADFIDFRRKIEESPVCHEEYIKKTEYLENWKYILNFDNHAKIISKKNILNSNLEINKIPIEEQISFKTKTFKNNVFALNKEETTNINNNTSDSLINNSQINSQIKILNNQSDNKLVYKIKNEDQEMIIDNKKNCGKYSFLENDNHFDGFIGYDVGKAYLCGSCVRLKVDRSHHCKLCGKCILKMDHHCPWLANCIGYSNYKFFLLTQLYGILTSLFVLFSYWETVYNNCFDYYSSILELAWNLFVYVNTLGLFSFLTWLFYINWTLMFKGLTVIENADRERFPSAKFTNQYDLGYYQNFTSVFGENPLIWFLPILPENKHKGFYFEKVNKKEEKLMYYI